MLKLVCVFRFCPVTTSPDENPTGKEEKVRKKGATLKHYFFVYKKKRKSNICSVLCNHFQIMVSNRLTDYDYRR